MTEDVLGLKKMRIFIICKINLSGKNAETTHLIEIAENLQRLGQEIIVFAPGIGKYYRRTSLDIKYVPAVKISRIIQTLTFQFSLFFYLVYYILKVAPEILYLRLGPFTLIPALIAKLFRKRYVVEVNGYFPDDLVFYSQASSMALFLSRQIEKINYSFANRIIVVVEGLKKKLKKGYKIEEAKFSVINSGANIGIFRPLDRRIMRRKLNLKENIYYVGFVGNFAPWQGVDCLIEAIPKVTRKIPDIQFLLIGGGILKKQLKEKVIELGMEKFTRFMGYVSYHQVPAYINSFDLCVAPFTAKRNIEIGCSPLKLYEYLACGRPVIASDIKGVGDLLEKNNCGLAIKPENPDALAKGIIQLIKNKDLRVKMGRNGRRIVESEYNWQNAARKTIEIFQSLVH